MEDLKAGTVVILTKLDKYDSYASMAEHFEGQKMTLGEDELWRFNDKKLMEKIKYDGEVAFFFAGGFEYEIVSQPDQEPEKSEE